MSSRNEPLSDTEVEEVAALLDALPPEPSRGTILQLAVNIEQWPEPLASLARTILANKLRADIDLVTWQMQQRVREYEKDSEP